MQRDQYPAGPASSYTSRNDAETRRGQGGPEKEPLDPIKDKYMAEKRAGCYLPPPPPPLPPPPPPLPPHHNHLRPWLFPPAPNSFGEGHDPRWEA